MLSYTLTNISTEAHVRGKKLTLTGVASNCTDDEMIAMLFDALQGSTHLEVNIAKLTEVDLSFLLLLCAIHRMSQAHGKTFKITGKLPIFTDSVAATSWNAREETCLYDSHKKCVLKKAVMSVTAHPDP